jgi:hypothetical protein
MAPAANEVDKKASKSLLFVNKQKQKNFIHWSVPGMETRSRHHAAGAERMEFFGSFLQKRTLPTLPAATAAR